MCRYCLPGDYHVFFFLTPTRVPQGAKSATPYFEGSMLEFLSGLFENVRLVWADGIVNLRRT